MDTQNHTTRDRLLIEARAFCEGRNISLATLATTVVNDGKFFARLERGGDCTTAIFDRFMKHFADNARATDTKTEAA